MHFNCKTYDPVLIAAIAVEYASGIAMWRLAKKYHIANETLQRLFEEIGVEHRGIKAGINASAAHAAANLSRRKLSVTERAEFCARYMAGGVSVADLSAEFGVSKGVARKILNKQEHIFREPAYRSYTLDSGFFSLLDSPLKAYWFGFILADGCVMSAPSPGLRVAIQMLDKGHLESLRTALCSNHEIKTVLKRYSHVGEIRSSEMASLDIRNPCLVADLVSHGCIPNKTNIETVVTGLSDEMFRHFARGYFDGNGSVVFSARKNRITKRGSRYVDPSWSCVGSLSIMGYLRDGLQRNTGLSLSELKPRPGCWCLSLGGVHNVRSFYDYLYGDGGPCLPRKKAKWEAGNLLVTKN